MKGGQVVDQSEPAALATLSREEKREMSILIKEIAPVCSNYEVPSRNLAEDYELCAGKDLNQKLYHVLVEPAYNVRRALNDDHAAHDMFGLNDMKGITRVMEVVMKPGVYAHILCCSLQCFLWYKTLALENSKVQASTKGEIWIVRFLE